ncbi:hypothetical protein SBA5_970051 [Candidatus Sulfotelmatomonas gaucii]|uniref:Uncharacterized protein n=1 Tax=Candidatus Sulfuritelmatomonas gaucii TaxID=2043161 RepID=A0A2N9MA31_9BACT|nr:hypothetical protein SBA5_970051 [Candidatus Sulfotelmatomonas gaucii]
MHGTPLPGSTAGHLSVKFGEHSRETASLCYVCSVTTIGRRDDVIVSEGAANTNRNRFLSDRQVHGTLNLVGRVDPRDFFLDSPYLAQFAVEESKVQLLRHCSGSPLAKFVQG